jgi:hypothetical protein
MKKLNLFTLCAATLLSAALVHAQAPAPAAPPATPPAPGVSPAPATATPAAPTPAGTAAPVAGAKLKPYSAADVQKLLQVIEALQFHIRMSETARWKGKEDKDLTALGTRFHKEAVTYYTPLVNLAQAHQVPDKDIATEVSKSDKSDMEKMNKAKADKWKLEYYELFAKNAKRNARNVEAAARTLSDLELKDLVTKAAKIVDGQAIKLESDYKELKNPKKDGKK